TAAIIATVTGARPRHIVRRRPKRGLCTISRCHTGGVARSWQGTTWMSPLGHGRSSKYTYLRHGASVGYASVPLGKATFAGSGIPVGDSDPENFVPLLGFEKLNMHLSTSPCAPGANTTLPLLQPRASLDLALGPGAQSSHSEPTSSLRDVCR